MAEFTRGRTFRPDEKLTPAKLNTLIDSGTITNIGIADLGPSLRSYFHSTSDPGVTTPRLWFNCTTSDPGLRYGFCSPSNASICGWLRATPFREGYYWASTRISYGTPLFVGRYGDTEDLVAMHKYDGMNLCKVYQAAGSTGATEAQLPVVVATESVTGAGPIRCAWAGLIPAFTYNSKVSTGLPLFVDHHNAAQFSSLVQVPATVLNNLVAYYHMNDGSGATQLDYSTNNYHLYKENAAAAECTGKLGTTLQFTEQATKRWNYPTGAGVSDFDIETGNYSWSFWAILNTITPAANNMELVACNWGSGGAGRAWRFFFNKPNNTFGVTLWNSAASLAYVYAGGVPTVSTWYCIQGYKEGNTLGLRINNGPWTTASCATAVKPYDDYFTIAVDAANLSPLNGAVDEIALWKGRRLTNQEFDAIYNSGAGIQLENISSTPELRRASIYGVVMGNADNSTPASNPTNFLLWGTGPTLQDVSQT